MQVKIAGFTELSEEEHRTLFPSFVINLLAPEFFFYFSTFCI